MKKILIILITGLLTFSFTGCKHNLGSGDVNSGDNPSSSGDNGGGSAGNGGKQTPPLPEFNWYETPEQLPEGTNGTFGKERTYVYFGVWPQDVVPEEDVAGLALDENAETTIELGNFKYVKGSDGSYYVQCTENHYNVEYEYNNGTKIGWSDRWFKAMPIKWCVLTKDYNKTGTALLLAENELTANVPYYVEETDRKIDEKTIYPNNYRYSTIRAYLNGVYESDDTQTKTYEGKGFLQTAFTTTAQETIEMTSVINNGESTTDANNSLTKADGTNEHYPIDYTCTLTEDKIFLLSEQEVTTKEYGFANYDKYKGDKINSQTSTRIREATDFAKANFADLKSADRDKRVGYGGTWWLRSPDEHGGKFVRDINFEGNGHSNNPVYVKFTGVVPALCVKLE